MAKKTHSGEESDRKIPPAKARPELFGSGDKIFDALTKLRGVRKLGKGKLGLREAIAAAREQAAAYERWQREGTPIRRVQVWVESRLMVTVSAEEDSVNLKAFNFDVESPRDAVMQILKVDDGEEPIVLHNLPLSTVSSKEFLDIAPLPNGQHIRLEINPQESGRFDVKVTFATEVDGPKLPAERPMPERLKAKAVGSKRMSNNLSYPRGFLQPPITNARTWSPASAVIAVVLVCALAFGVAFPWTMEMFEKESVAATKNNVDSQSSEGKLTKQERTGGPQVSKSRGKGGRNQQAGLPTPKSTDLPEPSAMLADKNSTNGSASEKEGDPSVTVENSVSDNNVTAERTAQTSTGSQIINPNAERVGAESKDLPSSVTHGQSKFAEPLNYSGTNRGYFERRLRPSGNSSRDNAPFTYADRAGSGFVRRQPN